MPTSRSKKAGLGLAALAGLFLSGCALTPGRVAYLVKSPAAQPAVVKTRDGAVRGVSTPDGQAFLAIPFAAAPVGALRFQPPAPTPPWTGVRDATQPGANCIQAAIPGEGNQSEDCLTLNLYAPHAHATGDAAPKPVMVWLYGGGFTFGDNVEYDPSRLAEQQDVIVIAPNYRLGALGFLAHPALRGAGEGAYALQDQQAALRWVRDNIAAFGGDPHKVTLFGESAGAWSVCYQLTAPAADGLFQRAILESGACTSRDSAVPLPAAEAGGLRMATALGCADPAKAADCLRRLPPKAFLKPKSFRRGLLGINSWAPVYGGDVLPLQPRAAFETGRFMRIPVINGTNHHEGGLFLNVNRLEAKLWTRASYEKILRDFFDDATPQVLAEYEPEAKVSMGAAYADVVTDATFACSALTLNSLLERKGPVFAYEFDDPHAIVSLPQAPFTTPMGAYHSSELAYVFRTPWAIADPTRFDPAQDALSKRMQAAWGQFARYGAPGWPADHGGDPVKLQPVDRAAGAGFSQTHHCAFWSRIAF